MQNVFLFRDQDILYVFYYFLLKHFKVITIEIAVNYYYYCCYILIVVVNIVKNKQNLVY